MNQNIANLTRSGGSDTDVRIPAELPVTDDEIFFGRVDKGKGVFAGIEQVVIPVQYASGTHFSIYRVKDGSFVLKDHSRNGTFYDGALVGTGNTVSLSNNGIIGLKFKNESKVEYTFCVLDNYTPQSSTPDRVLVEQLQAMEARQLELLGECGDLTRKLAVLEGELKSAREGRAQDAAAAKVADEQRSQEIYGLRAQLAAEALSTAEALESKRKSVESLQQQLLDVTSNATAERVEMISLRGKLAEAQAEASSAQVRISSLVAQLGDQQKALQGTRDSYVSGQMEISVSKDEVSQLRQQLRSQVSTINRLQVANSTLQNALESAEANKALMQQTLARTIADLQSGMKEQISNLSEVLNERTLQLGCNVESFVMETNAMIEAASAVRTAGESDIRSYNCTQGGSDDQAQPGSQSRTAQPDQSETRAEESNKLKPLEASSLGKRSMENTPNGQSPKKVTCEKPVSQRSEIDVNNA